MSIKDIVHVSLFAALAAVLGLFPPLTIPAIGVPITAQSMAPMLAGGILGARRGALAMALFLVLVAIGLPLLAGGRGGFGVLVGPSGGFLIGFIPAAWIVGRLTEAFWQRLNLVTAIACAAVGGIGAVYLLGIPWLAFAAKLSLAQAATGAAAFLPGDVVKAVVAASVIVTVKRAYPIIAAGRR